MGQINIESTPKMGAAAIFDPVNDPARSMHPSQFSELRFVGTPQNGNVGGRFSLPMEFDSRAFASAFVPEGSPVLAMQQAQPVLGTGYVSDGWQPWKYPDTLPPEVDNLGQPKMKEVSNPDWKKDGPPSIPKTILVPEVKEHPLKGKVHTVPSMEQHGITYVLMYRPIEVQQQVNEVYGLLSIDHMTAEVRGETINGAPRDDTGMLGEQQLRAARNIDSDILADRAAEENLGRSTVLHSALPSNNPARLTRPPVKLSR